ncbi:MAG: hypothetical protein Q7S63_00885 [bacterium]|nr:hypothetical protein [bacterium]
MTLSDRQEDILESVVEEYVKKAFPISSQLLEEEYEFGFSLATIRNELQFLTEKGYLFQPHISAGRVPTEKGYRFLVGDLLEEMPQSAEGMRIGDHFSLMQELAEACSGLALSYTLRDHTLWKEGWEEILQEPEFQEGNSIKSLTQFLRDMEDHIEDLKAEQLISLYIGRENPFSKVQDFSMIFSVFSTEPQGVVAIIGPKRMAYDKNINTFKELLYGKR